MTDNKKRGNQAWEAQQQSLEDQTCIRKKKLYQQSIRIDLNV